jgi:hypothetical protein
VTDFKKFGLKPYPHSEALSHMKKDDFPNLVLRITDLTCCSSILARNPNQEIIEDRRQRESYTKSKDVRLVLDRIRMVMIYFEWFLQMDSFIYQYHYPKFSNYIYFVLIFCIWTFNPQYLLSYMSVASFVVVLLHQKHFNQTIGIKF